MTLSGCWTYLATLQDQPLSNAFTYSWVHALVLPMVMTLSGPTQINPELGGEPALLPLVRRPARPVIFGADNWNIRAQSYGGQSP